MTPIIVTADRYAIVVISNRVWLMGEFGDENYRNFTLHQQFDDDILVVACQSDRYVVLTDKQQLWSVVDETEVKLIDSGVTNVALNDKGLFILNSDILTARRDLMAYTVDGVGYISSDSGRTVRELHTENEVDIVSIIIGQNHTFHIDENGKLYQDDQLVTEVNENVVYGVESVAELPDSLVVLDRKLGLWLGTEFMEDSPRSIAVVTYIGSIIAIDENYRVWSKVMMEGDNFKVGWHEVSEINSYNYAN